MRAGARLKAPAIIEDRRRGRGSDVLAAPALLMDRLRRW